ncbi:hypothetical protein Dimus_036448, partial [Dionaea muscipula]
RGESRVARTAAHDVVDTRASSAMRATLHPRVNSRTRQRQHSNATEAGSSPKQPRAIIGVAEQRARIASNVRAGVDPCLRANSD